MSELRALILTPRRPKPVTELRVGDAVVGWSTAGALTESTVQEVETGITTARQIRLRGRNVVVDADDLVMRVHKSERLPAQKNGPGSCAVEGCLRVRQRRGVCQPCYHRLAQVGQAPATIELSTAYRTELVMPNDLRVGDYVLVLDRLPRSTPGDAFVDDGSLFGVLVTQPMAWLWGAIIGDGSVSEGSIRIAAFGEFAGQVADALAEAYGLGAAPAGRGGLRATGRGLTRISRRLLDFGFWRRAAEKRVPEVVWGWPDDLQMAFCAGYAAADGHVGRDGQNYASCSRLLIDEVRALHMLAGHRVTNISTNMRRRPIVIHGVPVRHAKPLHNFVVSSLEPESYGRHTRRRLADFLGPVFGFRAVSAVEPPRRIAQIRPTAPGGLIVDGVPVWTQPSATSSGYRTAGRHLGAAA